MISDRSPQEIVIRDNYAAVLNRIDSTAHTAGRESNVHLVVVTKGQPLEKIRAVIQAGARNLGENYAEEAAEKMPLLSDQSDVTWHMIGHVQSRKASLVCEHFSWMHSLDSLKLAHRLNRFAGEQGRKLTVLLECNVSGEENKYGFAAEREQDWEQFLPIVTEIIGLPHLELRGLMTMAPYSANPESARPYFQRLRRLKDYLSRHYSQEYWSELSMGMSMDFEIAIQEGATIVRIGEAILGKRLSW